jgi:hypothetical protein
VFEALQSIATPYQIDLIESHSSSLGLRLPFVIVRIPIASVRSVLRGHNIREFATIFTIRLFDIC